MASIEKAQDSPVENNDNQLVEMAALSTTSRSKESFAASLLVCQRLLASPFVLNIVHRSQWRCLANSYSAVIETLIELMDRACSLLEPREQEIMCGRLSVPLGALHQAVQEGEKCMQQYSLCPIDNSSENTMDSAWLVQRVLMPGMSTEVVDVHLHRLLWTSSVIQEQIMRSAQIDGMESVLLEQTWKLCEIWAHVDAQDDFVSVQNRIMSKVEGETQELTSFILQRLSFLESAHSITAIGDFPPFMWVEPTKLKTVSGKIGEGSSGQVSEAVWLGGRFAVKEFFYIQNDEVFGREAMIQAQGRHPNVTALVCCTRNPSMKKCSLVMELMEQDLRVLLMKKMDPAGMRPPFPLLLALDLMLQIAQGMEHLHGEGLRIIHRDLKSSNILVSFLANSSSANDASVHMHLKITDFGMSNAKIDSSKYSTRPVGTTAWRAPELFSPKEKLGSDSARYTNKADVYSFAMVCYEILTAKVPFEGSRIGKRVLDGDRPQLPAYCPPALSSYIQLCWHVEPTKRPTFSQICRMIRYFKACIFLKDHVLHGEGSFQWLLHPLSPSTCDHIDDMIHDLVQHSRAFPAQPHVLVIPLEMYCCRVVLQSTQYGRSVQSRHESNSESKEARNVVADFTYEELRIATNNFSCSVQGKEVFRGKLADGRNIAVKVAHNFEMNHILIEQRIADRHPNIVSLYGWCQDRGDLLLVYEYMANGDLWKHIDGSSGTPVVGWQQRYQVVLQLAAALKHLHRNSDWPILHGAVHTHNILLDGEWNAGLGDCGQAVLLDHQKQAGRMGGKSGSDQHLQLASDIYDFGVVIIEIAAGRTVKNKVRFYRRTSGQCPVHEWAWAMYRKGEVMQVADIRLEGKFNRTEMKRALVLGLACTNERPEDRPRIQEVTEILAGDSEVPTPKHRPRLRKFLKKWAKSVVIESNNSFLGPEASDSSNFL